MYKKRREKVMVPDISIILYKIICILKLSVFQNNGASIFKSTKFCIPINREYFNCNKRFY